MKGIAIVLALAACGASGSSKTDLSKMSPDEACRTVSKRVIACKDTILPAMSAAMKKAGADDGEIKAMSEQMSMPMPCDGTDKDMLAAMTACYDDDCGKLAQCFVTVAQQAMAPAGNVAPAPHQQEVPQVAQPAPAPTAPPPIAPALPPTTP